MNIASHDLYTEIMHKPQTCASDEINYVIHGSGP